MLVSSLIAPIQGILADFRLVRGLMPRNVNGSFNKAQLDFASELAREVRRTQAIFAQWRRQSERSEQMLLDIGWPLPGHLAAIAVDEITEAYHDSRLSGSDVEEIIVDSYTPDRMREVISTWEQNKALARRMPVLREVLDAHIERRYHLSIPAILPQIEGVIAEAFGHQGHLVAKQLASYFNQAVSASRLASRSAAKFFVETLQRGFDWGDPIPRLSRNAILHGADADYASAANSLRLILFFDILQEALAFVSTASGARYHIAGCRTLRGRGIRRTFSGRYDAETAGLHPCRICLTEFSDSR